MKTRKPTKRMYSYEYPRPSVTVDAVVFGVDNVGLKLLTIERAGSPFKGRRALPGGFVQMNESLDKAVLRELREETGMTPAYMEQLCTFGRPDRDPRGRVISIAYMALIRSSDHTVKAASDAKDARWEPVDYLPDFAFDHREIVDYALRRLRAKVRYAPIGFDLLPKEFTLSELKALYEKLLQRTLDKRNFLKKILGTGLLLKTGNTANTNPPAHLYSFNVPEYERLTKIGFNFEV